MIIIIIVMIMMVMMINIVLTLIIMMIIVILILVYIYYILVIILLYLSCFVFFINQSIILFLNKVHIDTRITINYTTIIIEIEYVSIQSGYDCKMLKAFPRVVWLECRVLDTEVDGSNAGIST